MSEFVDHLVEALEPLGPVRARRMFGGHGIYLGDVMFALVAEDTLYLKVDAGNREAFERLALPPFTYRQRDRTVSLSYHRAPAEAIDDGEALCQWARSAYEAALRSGRRRPTPKRRG